jgi:hypothetical protein
MAQFDDTLVIVLAGGAGERLFPLTRERAKPAVYFGGPYRIIDFTLSNCINSGLRKIFIATQYKSLSLNRHVRLGWNVVAEELGEFIEILPPQKRVGEHWYLGTADAVYQNLYSVVREDPRYIVVLSGDHVYKMDYGKMLRFHKDQGAAATIGALEVPLEDGRRFGIPRPTPRAGLPASRRSRRRRPPCPTTRTCAWPRWGSTSSTRPPSSRHSRKMRNDPPATISGKTSSRRSWGDPRSTPIASTTRTRRPASTGVTSAPSMPTSRRTWTSVT